MDCIEYQKIYPPFKRNMEPGPQRGKLIYDEWRDEEIRELKDIDWTFREKIDGTNIRVHWDCHRVDIRGRTDNAQLHPNLTKLLCDDLFAEGIIEQVWGKFSVTFYGEGFGAKINGGGNYGPMQFALFDVRAYTKDYGPLWLKPDAVDDVARKMGLQVAPQILSGTGVMDAALDRVASGENLSRWGDFQAEGLVGFTTRGYLGRTGERIAVKIKTKDFA